MEADMAKSIDVSDAKLAQIDGMKMVQVKFDLLGGWRES
jgi:hypothetical protein